MSGGRSTGRRVGSLVVAAVACVLIASSGRRIGAETAAHGPDVMVVESNLAARWLDRAGVPHSFRSAAALGSEPISNTRVLILPVEAVQTPAAASVVGDFIHAGGRVVATYWGTIAPGGAEQFPPYRLCNTLGVKPTGWLVEPQQALEIKDCGAGMPPMCGNRVGVPNTPVALAEALPGTKVVARWGGDETSLAAGKSGAAFLHGSVVYLGAALLRPACDTVNARELFFWAIQRVAPDPGLLFQAKDRVASAMQAYSGVPALLGGDPSTADRAANTEALTLLADARTQLSRGSSVRATVAADRARAATQKLTDKLRQEQAENGGG